MLKQSIIGVVSAISLAASMSAIAQSGPGPNAPQQRCSGLAGTQLETCFRQVQPGTSASLVSGQDQSNAGRIGVPPGQTPIGSTSAVGMGAGAVGFAGTTPAKR